MIKNYDDFINRVVNTYVDDRAPKLWKDIKHAILYLFEGSKVTLMSAMNERLRKYKEYDAEKDINAILPHIGGLNKSDKDELAYEMLNKLVECMRDTMWGYYWDEQLENLTKKLDLFKLRTVN